MIIRHHIGSFASDADVDSRVADGISFDGDVYTTPIWGFAYDNSVSGQTRVFNGTSWEDYDWAVDTDLDNISYLANEILTIQKWIPINSNTSLASDVTLHVPHGSGFTIASGVTLTIAGPLLAGDYQIFKFIDSSSTVSITGHTTVNLKWFGAVGDNSADDTIAMNAFAASLGGTKPSAYMPPGTYKTRDTLDLSDLAELHLSAYGARVRGFSTDGNLAGNPLITLVDSTGACIYGLETNSSMTGANRPGCAIVLGRSTTAGDGGRVLLEKVILTGRYSVATLVCSGSELTECFHCRFTNVDTDPAYYDDGRDIHGLCGRSVQASNVERYFYGCRFNSKIGSTADKRVIWLVGSQRDITFRSCYATASDGGVDGGRGRIIEVSKDTGGTNPGYGNTKRVVIDDFRVESNGTGLDQGDSCLIYVDNPSYVPVEWTIRNVFYSPDGTVVPRAMIRVNQGGFQSWIIEQCSVENTDRLLEIAGGTVDKCRIVAPTSDMIDVQTGATLQDCTLESLDGAGPVATSSGGTIQRIHSPGYMITATADDTTPLVAECRVLKLGDNTGATAITNLDGGYEGQVVTLVVTGTVNNPTIADGGSFQLSAAWAPGQHDTLTLCLVGSTWYEVSRSAN